MTFPEGVRRRGRGFPAGQALSYQPPRPILTPDDDPVVDFSGQDVKTRSVGSAPARPATLPLTRSSIA